MENSGRRRLLDAAYRILAVSGAPGCTVRAVETAAGVPHGSVRHHFGSRDGLVAALVDDLVADDHARLPEAPAAMLSRMLGPDRDRTLARYELFLLAVRSPALRDRVVEARESLVGLLRSGGTPDPQARALVAAVDGLVLDGLLRGDRGVDPGVLLTLGATDVVVGSGQPPGAVEAAR